MAGRKEKLKARRQWMRGILRLIVMHKSLLMHKSLRIAGLMFVQRLKVGDFVNNNSRAPASWLCWSAQPTFYAAVLGTACTINKRHLSCYLWIRKYLFILHVEYMYSIQLECDFHPLHAIHLRRITSRESLSRLCGHREKNDHGTDGNRSICLIKLISFDSATNWCDYA